MSTFTTKRFTMLAVALTVMVLGSSALAQTTAPTMFLGEGVLKINMVEYQAAPFPAPGGPGGVNPNWINSPFLRTSAGVVKLETTGNGDNNLNLSANILRLGTIGKSSLRGQTLSFEIVAGAIDRNAKTGEVNLTGGFTVTQGGLPGRASTVTANFWQPVAAKRMQVVGLNLEFVAGTSKGLITGLVTKSEDWAELHTGSVTNRLDLFEVDNITVSLADASSSTFSAARGSRFDTLFVQNLKVTLAPGLANELNTFFNRTTANSFADGEHVGWANFFAVGVPPRELPDYRDWVLNY